MIHNLEIIINIPLILIKKLSYFFLIKGRTIMIIRPIEASDVEDFLKLSKKIDESGFMLYEPGEREMTVEQ